MGRNLYLRTNHNTFWAREGLKPVGGKAQAVRGYSQIKCICWFKCWDFEFCVSSLMAVRKRTRKNSGTKGFLTLISSTFRTSGREMLGIHSLSIWYQALIISIVLNYPTPSIHSSKIAAKLCIGMLAVILFVAWSIITITWNKPTNHPFNIMGVNCCGGDCFAWLFPPHTLQNHSSCFSTSYNCGHFVCIESAQRFVFVCVISRYPPCSVG